MQRRIGFVGIGLMGLPMCQRLLAAGHSLSIWNRSPVKCQPLVQQGALQVATPAELAAASDVIMLCLADAAAVEAVVFGEQGIATAAGIGKLLVDYSSIEPVATRIFAERLRLANGMEWVDCPVSGGVLGAEQGRLVLMAGGEVETIDALRPLTAAFAQRLTRMGPVGAGQVTKICNQMIVASNALLIAETVAVAERAGVDCSLLAQALAGGFADSLPFQILAPRMAERRFEPVQWRVKTLLKDLDNACRLVHELRASAPLTANARQIMRNHAQEGHDMADLSSVINVYAPPP